MFLKNEVINVFGMSADSRHFHLAGFFFHDKVGINHGTVE
jgi:hypothetical protein